MVLNYVRHHKYLDVDFIEEDERFLVRLTVQP